MREELNYILFEHLLFELRGYEEAGNDSGSVKSVARSQAYKRAADKLEDVLKLTEVNDCVIPDVSKSFTAEFVVNELEDCEHLDDAIMRFKQQI